MKHKIVPTTDHEYLIWRQSNDFIPFRAKTLDKALQWLEHFRKQGYKHAVIHFDNKEVKVDKQAFVS